MKLKFLFFAVVAGLTLNSCEKIKDALQIKNISFTTPIEDVEVPFLGIKDMTLPDVPITLDIDVDKYIKEKTDEAAGVDNIKEAKLVEFVVTKKSSSPDADLTVFKDAEVWAKSGSFGEKKIAILKNNTNKEKLTFEVVKDVDLIKYLKSPKGNKQVILKNIKVGNSGLTKFILDIKPPWNVTVGL